MTPQNQDLARLLDFDRQHVWPPYGCLPNDEPRYLVDRARGVWLELADGQRLIDGMSSWWSCPLGHAHPAVVEATRLQLEQMPHVMFGGLTHGPAIALAKKLIEWAPPGLDRVFYCDSGSVSVEVAMKMARQFFLARSPRVGGKRRFLALRGSYHGDTWGAMSVCDPELSMHSLYADAVESHLFAPRPSTRFGERPSEGDLDRIGEVLRRHAGELCALIVEPIAQGTGGMHFYSPEYLRYLRRLCTELDVLLIADEIATGMGRTGKRFACEHAAISPDILCTGKALTAGTLSFAATLTTERVSRTIGAGSPGRLMHGPTFMGNPLACAAALAALETLESIDWSARVAHIESVLKVALEPCRPLPAVEDVRVLGAIGVVEMKRPLDLKRVTPRLVGRGVWLRPFGKLLYTMPPFVAEDAHLDKIASAMFVAASEAR